jgi:hypothetical protein
MLVRAVAGEQRPRNALAAFLLLQGARSAANRAATLTAILDWDEL